MPFSLSVPLLALATATIPVPSGAAVQIDTTALALPGRQLQGMIREADRIWTKQGVAIVWATTAEPLSDASPHVLKVVDRPQLGPISERLRLGSVLFYESRVIPDDTLVLAVDSIGRLVDDAPWAGRRVRDWPSSIRSELMARALGRVLAHEIGHYLLAWRTHTSDGLMRRSFRGDLLVDPDRRSFAVPEILRARLRARLAQLDPAARLAEIR